MDAVADPTDDAGTASAAPNRLGDLTWLQRKTLDVLRAGTPVEFDPEFVDELCADVADTIEQFHDRLDETTLFVSKHRLASVFGCEVQHLLPDDFHWNTAIAGGQVAHRAIELFLNRRVEAHPAGLVDEAFEQLANADRGLADYLAGLPEAERALLRSTAVDKVITFQECFPPMPQATRVRTESSIRWPADGPIMLSGKVDLLIGANLTGSTSRKVLVDLKTGWAAPRHREDLRFYALVETLRSRVPPRKLASYYLDAGEASTEDVTEGTLRATARRTLDGIHREIELRVEGAEPVKRPGSSCRWCPLATDDCTEGAAYLAGRADDD
ncbi:MAG TPA: PD-(D/E)XK nuclease family protein [Ilumatobacter sp.]|nr:PD-(D/E)XK nuclease family protein [Ilumatobacter sp.]